MKTAADKTEEALCTAEPEDEGHEEEACEDDSILDAE